MEIGKKSLFYRMNEITQTVSVKDTRLLTESKIPWNITQPHGQYMQNGMCVDNNSNLGDLLSETDLSGTHSFF